MSLLGTTPPCRGLEALGPEVTLFDRQGIRHKLQLPSAFATEKRHMPQPDLGNLQVMAPHRRCNRDPPTPCTHHRFFEPFALPAGYTDLFAPAPLVSQLGLRSWL